MAEKIHEITAGRHVAYEVVEHGDGYMTIRAREDPTQAIKLPVGVRIPLARVLERIEE